MTPDRLGPPSVEPLSNLAWARIERILWARLDTGRAATAQPSRRYHPWLWIGPPVVAAAAAAAIVVTQPEGDKTSTPPRFGAAPVRYVAGGSPSSLSFSNTYISLEPRTAVVVSGTRTLLESGRATFSLAPSSSDSSFEVVAGDAKASTTHAIETKFHVGRSASIITIAVERGMIDLTYHGEQTALQAGQTWTSHTAPSAAALVETPPEIPQPSPSRSQGKVARSTRPLDSIRDRYERFASLEVRDPAAALAGYLELAKARSRWAEVSLFAAARLAGDHLDPRAVPLLKSYLKRFPRGANAPDARAILERLEVPVM